jgi:hypothetical protein
MKGFVMKRILKWVCLTLTVFLSASPAMAQQGFFREIGMGAYANQSLDLDEDLYSAGINLALIAPLSDGPTVRLDFRLEGQQGFFWGYDRGVEIAAAPALRAYFKWWAMRPYVECGVGLSYQSLDIYELGTDFNFLSFAGLGISLPLNDKVRLNLGYRLRHISNAGLDERNHGITANQVQFEVSWAF